MKILSKISQLLVATAIIFSTAVAARAAVVEHDWCTITNNESIKPGEQLVVKIKIKPEKVKPGMKINCDFHWMKKDGWGGVTGFTHNQTVKAGVTEYTFTSGFNYNESMDHIAPYLFYSKNGNFADKIGNAYGNKFRIAGNKPAAAAPAPSKSAEFKGKTVKSEFDWCTIEAAESIEPGQPGIVKVTLKGDKVKPGMKLSCDFHWMKRDGWGGTVGWNPAQTVEAGKNTYVFKSDFKVNQTMDHFYGYVFYSKNGSFENRISNANGPKTKFDFSNPATSGITRPATATFKKSWMKISFSKNVVKVGEEYDCIVEYYIDPSDSWGNGTSLQVNPYGPWIDNPDGVYNKHRHHVPYPGLWTQTKKAEVGKVAKLSFPQKITKAFDFNATLYVCRFIDSDGKGWPWDSRAGGPGVIQTYDIFSIKSKELGGATFGGVSPKIAVRRGDTNPASSLSLKLKATNVEGEVIWNGSKRVTFGNENEVLITLDRLTTPGVYLIEAEDENGNVRESTIANLPDVRKAIGEGRSRFGVTDIYSRELSRIAYKLGFSYCRHFTGWKGLEDKRGVYTFEGLDRIVDNNNAEGILPWIMLIGPPNWVLTNPDHHGAGYEPFPFNREAWRETAATLAKHYKGRIFGFEWLNEIVPGHLCEDPVADYIDFCRIGTEEVRKHAPEMKTMSAGGLWPRNFLLDLLSAGLGNHIDMLPVHYGHRGSIITAKNDLAARGITNVSVIDNETAAGYTVFKMPQLVAMTNSLNQCRHVMANWPAELAAGCELIIYFGGRGDACGNWSYMLDINTPRPVMASVATVIEKLGPARPIGTYADGSKGYVHVFEKNGKGIVALQPAHREDTLMTLDCPGVNPATLAATDYQGRTVKPVKVTATAATYKLTNGMAIIVDGAPLNLHAARTALEIDGQDAGTPQVSAMVIAGREAETSIKINNPFTSEFKGEIAIADAATRKPIAGKKFTIKAGDSARISLPLPMNAEKAVVMVKGTNLDVRTTTSIAIVSVDPKSLGNLVKNGSMEGTIGHKPHNWSGNGITVTPPGFGLGTALKLQGESWQHAVQNVDLPVPGKKYLYSAWVRNEHFDAGSNLSVTDTNNKAYTLFMPAVFSAGQKTDGWRYMTKIVDTAANTKSISPTPVGRGKGRVFYDNIRVTQYNGTEFMSEALKLPAGKNIKIDGKLDDWNVNSIEPLPLLCDNQIIAEKGYKWTEDSLAGVGYLRWDDNNLYLAIQVKDDKHVADKTGDDTLKCDSIELALHPLNRLDGEDMRAFEWFISAASPGGGSGKHTIYRNPKHSGGLTAGQLAKDSSMYEIVVSRVGDTTTYEVKIPWAETGVPRQALGTRFGLSIGLYDCDTPNGPTGKMIWGGGIHPMWIPGSFGEITLIE